MWMTLDQFIVHGLFSIFVWTAGRPEGLCSFIISIQDKMRFIPIC